MRGCCHVNLQIIAVVKRGLAYKLHSQRRVFDNVAYSGQVNENRGVGAIRQMIVGNIPITLKTPATWSMSANA